MATKRTIRTGVVEVFGVEPSGRRVRKQFSRKRHGEDFQKIADGLLARLLDTDGGFGGAAHVAAVRRSRSLTFEQVAERYKTEYLLTSRSRASNCVAYVDTLCVKWGKHVIATITKEAFSDWITTAFENPIRRMKKGEIELFQYSPKSIRHLVEYACHVLNWAKGQGIIANNPIHGVLDRFDPNGLKKEFKRRIRINRVVLNDAEFMALLETMPLRRARPALFARLTGMRRGEVCSLRWDQIRDATVFLEAGDLKECEDKSVVLDESCEMILSEIEVENIADGVENQYVFLNECGTPLSANSLTGSWRYYSQQMAKRTGNHKYLEATFHRLRNSYISEQILAGTNLALLGEQVGHHAVEMTLKYFVVDPERKKKLLRGGSSAKKCDRFSLHQAERFPSGKEKGPLSP